MSRLGQLILELSRKEGDFQLTSGAKSGVHYELGKTLLNPEGAFLAADAILDYMTANGIEAIGGLAMGAVPIVSAVAALSYSRNCPLSAFYVRKEAKGHGAGQRVDGHLPSAGPILFVDDVATSGNSILKAYEAVSDKISAGPHYALAILDREAGAGENLEGKGLLFHALLKMSDLEGAP